MKQRLRLLLIIVATSLVMPARGMVGASLPKLWRLPWAVPSAEDLGDKSMICRSVSVPFTKTRNAGSCVSAPNLHNVLMPPPCRGQKPIPKPRCHRGGVGAVALASPCQPRTRGGRSVRGWGQLRML